MPNLKGKHVTLRPFRPSDALPMFESLDDEETNRLTGTHATFTLEQIEHFVTKVVTGEDRASFIIADANTDDLAPLGEIHLLDIDTDNRSAGFRIAMFGMKRVGKGYGTEAIQMILAHGFDTLKLHRIALDVYAFNPRAIHVYEKVGFQREGVLRDALYYDGQFHDAIMMSILEDEWRAQQKS